MSQERRHDNEAGYVLWQLCEKDELERTDQWYQHSPEQVVKNTGFKAQHLWDFNVHCDGMVECRRPDMISKERRLRL